MSQVDQHCRWSIKNLSNIFNLNRFIIFINETTIRSCMSTGSNYVQPTLNFFVSFLHLLPSSSSSYSSSHTYIHNKTKKNSENSKKWNEKQPKIIIIISIIIFPLKSQIFFFLLSQLLQHLHTLFVNLFYTVIKKKNNRKRNMNEEELKLREEHEWRSHFGGRLPTYVSLFDEDEIEKQQMVGEKRNISEKDLCILLKALNLISIICPLLPNFIVFF